MRQILGLLLMLLLSVPAAFCQENKAPVVLKINIPSLGDETTFPTLRLSAERKIGVKTSLAAEMGYQLYSIEAYADTVHTKPRGLKLGMELRYYPRHQIISDMTGVYVATNIFFRKNKYTERLSYYPKTEEYVYHDELFIDNFIVKKSITGLHLIVGRQSNLKVPMHRHKTTKVFPGIFFDGSLGIGAFHRHVKNELREFDPSIFERYTSRHPNVNDAMTASGLSENLGLRPSFVFNFRIGYRL